MPSNNHKILFERLQNVTAQVKTGLNKNDFDELPPIFQEHEAIMAQLEKAGDCQDPELLGMLTNIKAEVDAVTKEIETRQAEIRGRLKITTNKRKLARAYGL